MNRAERRNYEKSGVSQGSIMQKYRKDAFDEGYKMGSRHIIEIVFYMVAYTIQYKLGFGTKRLQAIMKAIYNNVDSYRTGQLEPKDYDEIQKMMQDEYGIFIE